MVWCLCRVPVQAVDQQPGAASSTSPNSGGPSVGPLSAKQPSSVAPDFAAPDDIQKLGCGDRVSYRVIEDDEDPKSLTITDAGDIEVPYYGLARAEGKTCKQLAQEIKSLLEKTYYYRATVIVAVEVINKTRVLGRVYVAGQVRTPSAQDLLATETNTVSKAILKAGGFSDFADKKKVQVVRTVAGGSKKTFTVNVLDIWQNGQTDLDLVLLPEDQIFVPARYVNF